MKIERTTTITARIRYGVLKCQFCGHEVHDQKIRRGDAYDELLDGKRCPKCNESAISHAQKQKREGAI